MFGSMNRRVSLGCALAGLFLGACGEPPSEQETEDETLYSVYEVTVDSAGKTVTTESKLTRKQQLAVLDARRKPPGEKRSDEELESLQQPELATLQQPLTRKVPCGDPDTILVASEPLLQGSWSCYKFVPPHGLQGFKLLFKVRSWENGSTYGFTFCSDQSSRGRACVPTSDWETGRACPGSRNYRYNQPLSEYINAFLPCVRPGRPACPLSC